MKNSFAILAILLTGSALAQSPGKMSYQAVVRDANNNLVSSATVGMRLSILQGSASGTAVYVETQKPVTNANGLLSIEIGNGAVVSGIFLSIDWSDGPYFIKTETDPSGGTNYTITGTSQLLSVPYALHAKTAETLTGTISETDPVYSVSDAAMITATDIAKLGSLSGTNTGDQDLSALASKAALGDSTAQLRSEIPDANNFLTTETDPVVSEKFDFTGAAIGDLLQFNGTTWVKLTPDYISDYTVTESDVTNHQAALSITESQISDLQGYLEVETDPTVLQGAQTGEMQYWNGTAWITLPPGNEGQVLTMSNGLPAWGTIQGVPPVQAPTDVYNPVTGKVWMDRNLGASQVATSSTDAEAYGHLFQWGRAADGHESRSSGTTSTVSSSDTPGHGNFITINSDPYDWRSPQNNNLWQGVSGTNNPCPNGYRLPTKAEWDAERATWSSDDAAGAFASPLKLPVGGVRIYDGSFLHVGANGYYWSGTVSSHLANFLSNNLVGGNTDVRVSGMSVRCIKE